MSYGALEGGPKLASTDLSKLGCPLPNSKFLPPLVCLQDM